MQSDNQREYSAESAELDKLKITTLKDMVETKEISYDGVTNTYKIMYISNDQAEYFTPDTADKLIEEFGVDQ